MPGNVSVAMLRENLENLPEFTLPEGFSIRPYQSGDEKEWTHIHIIADKWNDVNDGLFAREFGNDGDILSRRQFYLVHGDEEVIGTASAWWLDDYKGLYWGRVHWVAILPEFQGRGLAKPLLATTLKRLRELGHERAFLTTSTQRLPAINLYLNFGFQPEPRTGEEFDAWQEILATLNRPPLPKDNRPQPH